MSGSNSAERILAILDLFTEDRLEWTLDELMAELGYSRPTLYRYLKTLKEAGFLTSLPGTGFTLGPRVVEMDYLMRKSDALVRHGTHELDRLARLVPCSALLVRWYGAKLLCVAASVSAPNPISSYPRGRPMPLARGAISRAILAFLPRRRMMPLIGALRPDLTDVGLGDTPEGIAESLRGVRRRGYALARGEVTPGVTGIAAPVFDAGRSPIAALCTTLKDGDVPPERIARLGPEVRAAADRLSEALTHRRALSQDPEYRRA